MDCRYSRWQDSMIRHSKGLASQHKCRGWAIKVQAAAKQDTQPAGQQSVDCVSTGLDTDMECVVSQDGDASENICFWQAGG